MSRYRSNFAWPTFNMPRAANSWIAYYKDWLKSADGVAEKERQKSLAEKDGRKFKITSVMSKCKESYAAYKSEAKSEGSDQESSSD